MIELTIIEIVNQNYTLKDNNNKIYNYNMEFYIRNISPEINDKIYINKYIFKAILFNQLISLGELNDVSGREITNYSSDKDIVVLKHNNEKMYLKLLYG